MRLVLSLVLNAGSLGAPENSAHVSKGKWGPPTFQKRFGASNGSIILVKIMVIIFSEESTFNVIK